MCTIGQDLLGDDGYVESLDDEAVPYGLGALSGSHEGGGGRCCQHNLCTVAQCAQISSALRRRARRVVV